MKRWVKTFLNSLKWVEAKTMKNIPHEYSVLYWNYSNKKYFIEFAKLIQSEGYEEEFYGKKYKYINVDGYKYWTMDFPIENTNLINRAKL